MIIEEIIHQFVVFGDELDFVSVILGIYHAIVAKELPAPMRTESAPVRTEPALDGFKLALSLRLEIYRCPPEPPRGPPTCHSPYGRNTNVCQRLRCMPSERRPIPTVDPERRISASPSAYPANVDVRRLAADQYCSLGSFCHCPYGLDTTVHHRSRIPPHPRRTDIGASSHQDGEKARSVLLRIAHVVLSLCLVSSSLQIATMMKTTPCLCGRHTIKRHV